MRRSRLTTDSLLAAAVALSVVAGAVADVPPLTFDRFQLASNSYWNGSDLSGGFKDQNVHLSNAHAYGYWSGMVYSNVKDTNTTGWLNQYAVFAPGTGYGGTGNYVVVFDASWEENDIITLPRPGTVRGFYVNNTTYAALEMLYGGYGKQFGGSTGNDPDWFMLTITAKNNDGTVVGTTDFYLADYRFADNANDYIVSDWRWVDLTSLGDSVKSLHFTLTSSDNGTYGMNTPAYFALDHLSVDFAYEPAAGYPGSAAIHMHDTNFIAWATGWTNYNVGPDCDPARQTPELAVGRATNDLYHIVSLGRGGDIEMTFDLRIANGDGADFAVFENAIDNTFLELGYVEVSSDTTNFFRFENHSMTTNPVEPTGIVDPTAINGYCSKYRAGYGTPFDLAELDGTSPLLDVNNIQRIRIVDIIGDGTCTDSFGNVIYDPYTNSFAEQTFPSAGVDLDAIGILNTSHPVTSTPGPNGSIVPDGIIYVPEGHSRTFDIAAAPHYHIAAVRTNGIPLGAAAQVTLANIRSAQFISAEFSNASPVAVMSAPQEGASYGSGNEITLMGNAMDMEDGALTNGFTWASDIDGALGTGRMLRTDQLSEGTHEISLTAVDPGGASNVVSRTITILADSDADGIPDDWEILYYGGATNANPTSDSDEDTVNAYDEWIAGTIPTNRFDYFSVSSSMTTNMTGFVLEWESRSNRVYDIYSTTNLAEQFRYLGTLPATPPANAYTNAVEGVHQEYFRIEVTQ